MKQLKSLTFIFIVSMMTLLASNLVISAELPAGAKTPTFKSITGKVSIVNCMDNEVYVVVPKRGTYKIGVKYDQCKQLKLNAGDMVKVIYLSKTRTGMLKYDLKGAVIKKI